MSLDESIDARASRVAGLAAAHGRLRPSPGYTVSTPTKLGWWLEGDRGRVGVSVMLTPEHPPKLQVVNVVR